MDTLTHRRFRAVVFDFDGTLADTKDGIAATVNRTLVDFRQEPTQPMRIHRLVGLSLSTIFRELAGRHGRVDIQEMVSHYRALYDTVAPLRTRLFDGIRELLAELDRREVLLAVATSKGSRGVRSMLTVLEVARYFQCVIADDDVANKKPHPEMVECALAHLRASPNEAIVVGDTRYDVIMGQAAGTATCAVTYGSHPTEQLREAAPTYSARTVQELREVLLVG